MYMYTNNNDFTVYSEFYIYIPFLWCFSVCRCQARGSSRGRTSASVARVTSTRTRISRGSSTVRPWRRNMTRNSKTSKTGMQAVHLKLLYHVILSMWEVIILPIECMFKKSHQRRKLRSLYSVYRLSSGFCAWAPSGGNLLQLWLDTRHCAKSGFMFSVRSIK